jgi:hypothetical protein
MNFGDNPENYYESKAEYWEKIAKKMAKLLMDLGAGEDVHNEAYKIVEKHFPKLYKKYE